MESARSDAQYEAWGVLITNNNMASAHLANGLVQLLRIYPALLARPLIVLDPAEAKAKALLKLLQLQLKLTYGGQDGWRLPEEARGLCVTQSKEGPCSLEEPHPKTRAAVDHLRAHMGGGLPSAAAHKAIAAALNADRRVFVAGGSDPTTPGLTFAGITTTHTLSSMCAPTLVALLSSTPTGRGALRQLYEHAAAETPHSRLVALLRVDNPPPSLGQPPTDPGGALPLLPLPGEKKRWLPIADQVGELFAHLLSWVGRGIPAAELMMAAVDLMGLVFGVQLLRWSQGAPLPLICPAGLTYGDRGAVAYAQRAFSASLVRLDDAARRLDLIEERDQRGGSSREPAPFVRNLLRVTGWLTPQDSRGGAKQALWPGARQLTTLILALLAPGEELSWEELRARARKLLHIELGGSPSSAAEVQALDDLPALRRIAALNQAHLVALGLGRRESDNVIRIDGGYAS